MRTKKNTKTKKKKKTNHFYELMSSIVREQEKDKTRIATRRKKVAKETGMVQDAGAKLYI